MPVLAKDRFAAVAPYVTDSGVCADDEASILGYLNIVVPMLMKRMDSKGTIFSWCVPSADGCFALPEDCLEARQLWLDGFPLVQRDEWYEGKLTVGLDGVPGRQGYGRACNKNGMMYRRCDWQNIFDVGDGFATPLPWPKCTGAKLGLMAESDADAGQVVTVNLMNQYADSQQFQVELPAQQEVAIVDCFVKEVLFLRKPQTYGNVVAFIMWGDGRRERICHYTPRTITASWRRKKLPRGQRCEKHGMLLIKGKARFMPIASGDDTMLITDEMALAEGCLALNAQRRNDPAGYNGHLTLAVNELEKQLEDGQSRQVVSQASWISPFGASARTKPWC